MHEHMQSSVTSTAVIMLPRSRKAALLALLFTFSTTVLQCESQCTVSQPNITGSNRDDVCLVVSQGSLTYTCTHPDEALFWTTNSSVISGNINVRAGVSTSVPPSQANGVTLTGSHNDDPNCVNSTLIFTGDLTSLRSALNGFSLTCNAPLFNSTSFTFVIPDIPGAPTLSSEQVIVSGQTTLEWAPPTTGGEGVSIERYLVSVSGAGYTCPPDQCNVTTPHTTITGLEYNTSYTVTVRAVNCVGEGVPSDPVNLSHLRSNVSLECDARQPVCPNSSVLVCTCTSNGTAFRWSTDQTGVFNSGGVVLDKTTQSTMHSAMGFSVAFLDDSSGNLTRSVLTYSSTTGMGVGDLVVTCEDPYGENTIQTESISIITTAVPGAPQVTVNTASCDTTSGLYNVTLQWSDNTTAPAQYYLIDVTSHPEFMCPKEQCNTTAQSTTITGLSCSTDLSFTIRGANCAGLGEITTVSHTIAQVDAPTITKASLANGIVAVDWRAPEGRSCMRISGYTLALSHSNGATEVTMTVVGRTSVSVSVATSNQYSVSLTANTNCGTSLAAVTMTTGDDNGSTGAVLSTPVVSGLGVAIVIVFLVTAVLSSLITLLITWLYCTKKWSPKHPSTRDKSHSIIPDTPTPNIVKELEYDDIDKKDRERVYSYETPLSIKPNPVQEIDYDNIVNKQDQDRKRVYSYETPWSIKANPVQEKEYDKIVDKHNHNGAPVSFLTPLTEEYDTAVPFMSPEPVPAQGSSGDVELKPNIAYAPTVNNAVIEMVYDSVRL